MKVLTQPVTEDLVSYMDGAMHYANESFLTEDPQFAIDFAPNGKTTNTRAEALLRLKRDSLRVERDNDQETICKASPQSSTVLARILIRYSTLEAIGEHGSKAFYEGPIGMPLVTRSNKSNFSSKLHRRCCSSSKWDHDTGRYEELPSLNPKHRLH